MPYERSTMWKDVELIWKHSDWTNSSALSDEDIAVAFASSGYYGCMRTTTCSTSVEGMNQRLQKLLNNASPSFTGALLKFKRGMYHYICSRNNNFTNRSQKGILTVTA